MSLRRLALVGRRAQVLARRPAALVALARPMTAVQQQQQQPSLLLRRSYATAASSPAPSGEEGQQEDEVWPERVLPVMTAEDQALAQRQRNIGVSVLPTRSLASFRPSRSPGRSSGSAPPG